VLTSTPSLRGLFAASRYHAPMTADPLPASSSAIVTDLPCTVCNYNLKGLLPAALCPECGQPIARTLTLALTDAPPAWLRRQAATMLLLTILALLSYAPAIRDRNWQFAAPFRLAGAVVLLYAAIRLGAPEHDVTSDRAGAWRRGLLLAAGYYAAVNALVLLPDRMIEYRFLIFLYYTNMAAFVALNGIVTRYLFALARRANDPPLTAHARLVLWAMPAQAIVQVAGPLLIFTAIDFGPTSMFIMSALMWTVAAAALAYVLLLGRLHETLRAAANRAAEVPVAPTLGPPVTNSPGTSTPLPLSKAR
jgi:hypothetical protein